MDTADTDAWAKPFAESRAFSVLPNRDKSLFGIYDLLSVRCLLGKILFFFIASDGVSKFFLFFIFWRRNIRHYVLDVSCRLISCFIFFLF